MAWIRLQTADSNIFRKGIKVCMASTESTVKKKQNPFKHTSDVQKPEAHFRLRGYEYYVRTAAEILQVYMHACVIVLQYNTPVNDVFLQKGTTREDSGCAVSPESAFLQLQPRIMIRTSMHA